MSKATDEFLLRLDAMRDGLEVDSLVSKAPGEVRWNNRARLIRNGLLVVGFAALEDFLRSRLAEIISQLSNKLIKYEHLPEGLRNAATSEVVEVLPKRSRLAADNGDDPLAFVRRHAALVASAGTSNWELSGLACLHRQDNINFEELRQLLDRFGIVDGWKAVASVARRAGLGTPDLGADFKNLVLKRHRAAHWAAADVEFTELSDSVSTVFRVAFGFDAVLSTASSKWLSGHFDPIAGNTVTLRIIAPAKGGKWKELKSEADSTAKRTFATLDAAKSDAAIRSRSDGAIVVVRTAQGVPSEWLSPTR